MTTRNQRQIARSVSGIVGPERRLVNLSLTTRAEGDDRLGFAGHAAVFGVRTYIGWKPYGFWETIRAGAFKKTIGEADVRMLHNHDPNLVLARNTIDDGPGRLALSEDDEGLATDAEFVPTTYARDVHLLVQTRAVTQMSFAFTPVTEEWSRNEDTGEDERTLVEVALADVSTVTYPSYVETDAAVRSAGLGLMLDSIDLDPSARARIIDGVRKGTVTPELLPALRAASDALAELVARTSAGQSPTGSGSDDVDPLAIQTEAVRRKMRLYASRSADYSRSKTR